MNHVFIAGHLGSDPEVKFTSGGQKVTTLRVACNSRKSGKDETIWWRVTIWGEQFDKMIPYFKKGSPIMVTGELNKPEIFNDKEGRPQISLNMVATQLMFSPFGKGSDKSDDQGSSQMGQKVTSQMQNSAVQNPADINPFDSFPAGYASASVVQKGQGPKNFDDEEIPF